VSGYIALEVLTAVLAAITMGLALAHALDLPGKMRLSEEQYRTVQPIYYPGFTIGGGIAEVGRIITMLALLLVTPGGTRQFWLIAGALAATPCHAYHLLGHDAAREQVLA
jgi:hypothetical protein